MSRRLAASFSLLALVITGCESTPTKPALHPLNGTLTQSGKPVVGGGLIFIPESGAWGGRVVNANVNPDGTFTAETSYTGGTGTVIQPGVPAGRYQVVYHPPSDGQKVGQETTLPEPITVAAGDNTVTLVLPEKGTPAGAEPAKPAGDTPPTGR